MILSILLGVCLPPDLQRDVDQLSHVSLRRRMAARARVLKAGPKAIPSLLGVLRGNRRDPYKRHAALYLLGELGDLSASKTLIRIATRERESERQRFWALSSLMKIREEEALPIATTLLGSDREPLRRVSIQLILSHGPDVSVPIFLKGLRSETRAAREASAAGLRRLSGEKMQFDPDGDDASREEAVKRWEVWWQDKKSFLPPPKARPDMQAYRMKECTVWTDRGEARAHEIGERVAILRRDFARWFGMEAEGYETRVREFAHWEDFQRYGAINQWGFHIVAEFFYSPFLHEVITFDTGRAGSNDRGLIHEVFHDFYHRNTETQLPWFNEGMAEHFETWMFEDGKLVEGARNMEWMERARKAIEGAPPGFLKDLMGLTQEQFYFQGREGYYAVSWAWVDFLAGREDGKKDLKRIFRWLRKSSGREKITRRVFGTKKLERLVNELRESIQEGREARKGLTRLPLSL
ncbi:MAG: HEAT repeat domain-containing protein [Planctomycetota bacterium]|nr:HEAT repeat domain-containing protein [Planctomycetota bacterium]